MRRADLSHAVRERLKRLPAPYGSHYGVVPLPPPEEAIDLRPLRDEYRAAENAMLRAERLAAQVADPYLVTRVLTRREAVASSAIEGTNSTLDELLAVEETEGEGRTAARQVRDYALALDRWIPIARERGPSIFRADLVRALHVAVMADDPDYEDVPGELRRIVVWIGGRGNIAYSTYNPAPPDDVAACLEQSLDYMRADGMHAMTQSLITRMAIAHSHFEAVHPFRDGNGRVGRLLLPLMMAADRRVPLYLAPYTEANKQAYYDALKAGQQRLDWLESVGFMARAIVATVDELEATHGALVALTTRWREQHDLRRGSAAARALDVLLSYPVLTVNRLAKQLDVTYAAADRGIARLVEIGILVERTGYKRNRIFAAPALLDVINRPFGAEPILDGAS